MFNASTFASSRGEGANKDYKSGVVLRTLSLVEAYEQVTSVQDNKKKKAMIKEIREGTTRVDSRKLSRQWYTDIDGALCTGVSGYARNLCYEEMGGSGNYRVVGCYDSGNLPDDEEMREDITLTPVAEVPDVDPTTLDLRQFTLHLDDAELAEKDPFRRAGVGSFLDSHPELKHSCQILQVENSLHSVSQYLVFYDPVETEGVTVYKSHWCTCGMKTTAGIPCRHYFAAHRHMRWVGFHMHLINNRWHTSVAQCAALWTYGNKATKVQVPIPAPPALLRATSVHCPGLDGDLEIPVHQQRHAKQTYGKLWGKSRTVVSMIAVDYGYVQEAEAEELLACLERLGERLRKRKAMEAEAPEARALLEAKQSVSNVKDFYRPDKKQKGLRKCSRCHQTGHNRATCPLASPPPAENMAPAGDVGGETE